MIHFCLLVSSIVGSWCFAAPDDFVLPGNCIDVGDINICEVDASEMQVRASWYDPALLGVNCMEPCDQLGDGTPVVDGYGRFAACPVGWYWRTIEFEIFDQSFVRQCRDHGPKIHPGCGFVFLPNGREYRCFITVDFLEKETPWFFALLLDWRFAE